MKYKYSTFLEIPPSNNYNLVLTDSQYTIFHICANMGTHVNVPNCRF
jgi:hypothetical protein